MQSLFLTAIGDARDKGARALEAFSYRYSESDSAFERFQVHKTIFPRDFLNDFGFQTVRTQGPVELARLELGGLVRFSRGSASACCASCGRRFVPAPGAAAALGGCAARSSSSSAI